MAKKFNMTKQHYIDAYKTVLRAINKNDLDAALNFAIKWELVDLLTENQELRYDAETIAYNKVQSLLGGEDE